MLAVPSSCIGCVLPPRTRSLLGLALHAAILVVACSASDSSSENFSDFGGIGTGGSTGVGGGATGSGGAASEPPEDELDDDYQAPVAAGRFLWSANPASNRVALIDAESLDVLSLKAGHEPTYLAPLPASDGRGPGAAVINVRGKNASFFSLAGPDAAASEDDVESVTVPLFGAANAWKVTPSGSFAIAWTNAAQLSSSDPTEGFQDVTVIDRRGAKPTATRLSVGYRPSQVFLSEDEAFAFVVSEPGISVIELTAEPSVVRELFLPEQALSAARDVSFVPSGEHALVRVEGQKKIWIIDTEADTRVEVSLPQVVTDLDVSRDGSRAVAVMRRPTVEAEPPATAGAAGTLTETEELSRVAVLPLDGIVGDPASITVYELDELFGSAVVSKDGKRALLFTTGVAHETLGILDLDSGAHRELDLKAPVKAVYLTPDAKNAVALLAPPAGSVKAGAFALIPVEKALPPRIEGTDAPTFLVALSSSPARALITTRDDLGLSHAAYLASFPSLSVDPIALPSRPLAAGIVPDAGKGFIAEAHTEGRITFVELEDGSARTLTGFELGAKVIDGGKSP